MATAAADGVVLFVLAVGMPAHQKLNLSESANVLLALHLEPVPRT